MRKTRKRGLKGIARRRQRDVLCDVMLSARQCETWLTLDELAKLTHYPPASISAQLRHLRKPEYGGFVVEKQPRVVGAIPARRRLWNSLGIPAPAGDSQKVSERALAGRWKATFAATGGLLNRWNGCQFLHLVVSGRKVRRKNGSSVSLRIRHSSPCF